MHKAALPWIGEITRQVEEAAALAQDVEWNVAKIEKGSVSLLLYETFDADFPVLLESAKITLPGGAITRINYRTRANPPILHRKELLLSPDDPRLPTFRALTRAAEDHGLFANPNRIGTRAAWSALIASAGLILHKGRLIPASERLVDVARHRTAILRRDLSQPIQLMMRLGVITKPRTIFDYGCGQGEDVAALRSEGYDAVGWDPHHATDGERRPADVVNLGFVLNVIEDRRERVETLKSAWSFARQALCIAVIRSGKLSTGNWTPYGDGVLTSRGTFQKYFQQQEFFDFVASATGERPLALAPGIVIAFRDKELEQEVQFRRRSRALIAGALPKAPAQSPRPSTAMLRRVQLDGVIDSLRAIALSLGRAPDKEEAPTDVLNELTKSRISWSRTAELLRGQLADDKDFNRCRETRRNDLLVHIALTQFPGSPKYRTLPKSIQLDIKAFFQSNAAAQEEGRRLLFAAGERAGVQKDIEYSVGERLGGIRNDRWFRFRSSALQRLPPRLRVLVGCAEVLQGGVEACDFVDIDLQAPRIVMVTCDDIDNAISFLTETITVDLNRLKVSANKVEPFSTPIYFKSRFLPPDDELILRALAFEDALAATGLFKPGTPTPPWPVVQAALKT